MSGRREMARSWEKGRRTGRETLLRCQCRPLPLFVQRNADPAFSLLQKVCRCAGEKRMSAEN
jgi:hypothetical protein